MQYLEINKLDGIPDNCIDLLLIIAQKIKRQNVLSVVLFFMSDMKSSEQTLKNIEYNMRKIFHGEYKDYAASNIRGYLDKETENVKKGLLLQNERLFLRRGKGVWCNSNRGNMVAKQILNEQNIEIILNGKKINGNEKEKIDDIHEYVSNLCGEERLAIIKVRVNQSEFRKKLLNLYSECRICGLAKQELLIASHIKSWADSDAYEKLDVNNGFLLCPVHDALFDKHLISFNNQGNILISESIHNDDFSLLNINNEIKIDIMEENIKYLGFHRMLLKE